MDGVTDRDSGMERVHLHFSYSFRPVPPSDDDIKRDLEALYRVLDSPPTSTDAAEKGKFNIRLYYSLLDGNPDTSSQSTQLSGWEAILEQAGIETDDKYTYSAVYSDSELKCELADVAALTDRNGNITPTIVQEESDIAYATFTNRFGEWPAPLVEADIISDADAYDPAHKYPIEEAELEAELQQMRDKLGRPPYLPEMDQRGAYSSETYLDRYGSWEDAVDAAGLSTHNVNKQRSEEELLEELERLYDKFGKQLSKMSLRVHAQYSPDTYIDRFGSIDTAYEQADLD